MVRAYVVPLLAGALVVHAAPASAQSVAAEIPELPSAETVAATPATPAPATAPAIAEPPRTYELPPPEGTPRYALVRVNAGVRIGYVATSGFDSFAKNDALPQFSLGGTYPVFHAGKLVFGAGLGWDVGARSDSLRGLSASLTAHRFSVPLEARYAVTSGFEPFARVAPGASLAVASVHDASAPNDLSASGWAFSADASVGASILLGPRNHFDRKTVRFWLAPEIGYAFTTAAKLSVTPDRDEALGSDERTNLRSLALSGLFWRASLGASF